jgi:hypothetical protein
MDFQEKEDRRVYREKMVRMGKMDDRVLSGQ